MFPCEDSKALSVRLSVHFFPCPEKRNNPGFVNISPTLVINTSLESSSRVLQHGKPKIWIILRKISKLIFDLYLDLCWRAEITLASSIYVLQWLLIYQWEGLYEYYSMETQKIEFLFKKVRNWNLTCIFTSSWRAEISLASSISVLH